MQYLIEFDSLCENNFNLTIALLKNEYKFNLVGILKRENEIIDYCQTINISNNLVYNIYEKIRDNVVFPCHFYNVIDDL